MDFSQLQARLRVVDGQVIVSEDALRPFYKGQSITISGAKLEAGGDPTPTLRLSGTSSFQNVPDLPVSARFDLDAAGAVRAVLRYRLRDLAPGPAAWVFSRSFPKLPAVLDYDTPIPTGVLPSRIDLSAGQRPLLDALDLFDTWFVVSTHDGQDPETGVPIAAGINFVSKMRPQGMLGVLEYTLGEQPVLTLHGPIHIPLPTERAVALPPLVRPWDRPASAAPGIHLEATLGAACTLGKLSLERTRFHIYSPTSTDWMADNPSFSPMHGYTGTLSIPSAGVTVDLGAELAWNLPTALLHGDLRGVTLRKLAQLLDLAGTDELLTHLPAELQKAVDALQGLALMRVAVDLALVGLVPAINSVHVTIGLPGLDWKVFGDHLVVRELACRISVRDPLGSPDPSASSRLADAVSVTMLGTLDVEGVPLAIQAGNDDGFTVRAWTERRVVLPLDRLLKRRAPNVPSPGPLSIESVGVRVTPGRGYAMSMLLADQPPWVIGLGRAGRDPLVIRDVVVALEQETGQPLAGSFAGALAFDDDLVLQASYDIPGNFVIRSTVPRVNLTRLIERLCDVKVALPGDFDLRLENASILIQKRNDDYTLQLATAVAGFGLFAFEVRKVAGRGWGFAAGMDLGGAGLSKLPGLGKLKSIEGSFKLEKLLLTVASFADAGFVFPDMAQFNRPQLATGKLSLPAQAQGVLPGLMLFAEWKLDGSSREQKLLKALLGLGDTLSATLAIGADPTKEFRLHVGVRGDIARQPFQGKLGVEVSGGKPSFFLTGSLTAKVQGQPQTFDLTTAFVAGGAFLSATVKGGAAINCGPFKLSNLALQIGVNWAGVPSLGVAATIDVKNFESSIAVFFDSTDPSRSLFAGSITSLTAKDVLDTLVGGSPKTPLDEVLKGVAIRGTQEFTIPGDLADELDGLQADKIAAAFAAARVTIPSSLQQLLVVVNKQGEAWHLTDLSVMRHYELKRQGPKIKVTVAPQFYMAPQPTFIGTIKYPQGFYLNAAIAFAGFDAAATINISQSKGFAVAATMDRIVLVDEKLFSVASARGHGGPTISISTYAQPDNPVAQLRLPHFYLSGRLTLLGLEQSIYASVTVEGVDFELSGALVPGVDFDVSARFGKAGLEAGGSVKIGVGTIDLGPLGKAKINTEIEAGLELDIDTDVELQLAADFEFAGQHVDLGKFKVEARTDALAKLPETLARKMEAALRDVFKDAGKWAGAVAGGVMDGVDDAEKVFRDVFGKSESEARELAKSAGREVKQVTRAIENTAKKEVKKLKKGLKKIF